MSPIDSVLPNGCLFGSNARPKPAVFLNPLKKEVPDVAD